MPLFISISLIVCDTCSVLLLWLISVPSSSQSYFKSCLFDITILACYVFFVLLLCFAPLFVCLTLRCFILLLFFGVLFFSSCYFFLRSSLIYFLYFFFSRLLDIPCLPLSSLPTVRCRLVECKFFVAGVVYTDRVGSTNMWWVGASPESHRG